MKKLKSYFKQFLIVVASCSLFTTLIAQNEDDITRFLNAGKADASKLVNAYFTPAVESAAYGMAGGWLTTAKTHRSFGVDIGFSINTAFIPDEEDYFDPDQLGLSSTTTFSSSASNGLAPTFMGPKVPTGYTFSGDLDGDPSTAPQSIVISGPEGLNIKKNVGVAAVPIPVLQLGIGTIKNTDLKFRYVPEITFGKSRISMIGVGIMHDIKQYIPGIKALPFELSILVAYNNFKGTTNLENNDPSDPVPDSQDGEGIYKFNSIVSQLIISKKISVLTLYGGAGYTTVKTDARINGTYTIEATPAQFYVTDPISIDFKNKSAFFIAGLRLKFGPFFLNGNYTLQKYQALSVGLGFSFL